MKKVLITGANSYIGTAFEKYVSKYYPECFQIDTLDMLDGTWQDYSFSIYDTVFHVAGIAHADVSHVTEEVKQSYYKVNTELAVSVARKAKEEGVNQFIFMSSMIVYGNTRHVTAETKPQPANFYGDSKWQADFQIQQMNSEVFHTAVLRPPMIYGKGSKGNYPALAKLAKKLPFFPKVKNQRSMLYIENLCEFLYVIIKENRAGVFFPQNREFVNTGNLVKEIARVKKHNIWISPLITPFAILAMHVPGKIGNLSKKAFGNSFYDLSMSDIGADYCKVNFSESIIRTESEG